MHDAESIQTLINLAQEAHKNRVIPLPNDHTRVILVDDNGIHQFVANRVLVKNTAEDFATIAKVCETLDRSQTCSPEVWYTPTQVEVVHRILLGAGSQDDRYDRTKLYLPISSQFRQLVTWSKSNCVELKQVDLYFQIRTTFHNCLPDNPNLKDLIGKVDIRKAQEASGTVKTGGVSMSRHMVAEASGADKLPEFLVFRVPYWSSPLIPLFVSVRAAFELNPQTESFRLSVLPGEIEGADLLAGESVAAALAEAFGSLGRSVDSDDEDSVTLYRGMPS